MPVDHSTTALKPALQARTDRRQEGGAGMCSLGRRALLLSVSGAIAAPAIAAPALPRPTQTPVLKVSGKIGAFNNGDAAIFDRPMLEGLGMASFTTATPWYDRPVTFEGPRMAKLMDAIDARGETVTAIALNDYVTEIPRRDFARYGVLLAMKRDGAYMPARDKGPLFVVYPYDTDPELRHRRFYSRSAWQVAEFVVS
jgi:hypothetical protein